MEEETGAPSEASVRRSKRVRAGKLNANNNIKSDYVTGERSPNETAEETPDDYEEEVEVDVEVRPPKAKRNRTAAAPSTDAKKGVDAQNLSLIEAVKGSRKSIPQVAKLWVERYEKDPKPAMIDLLSMLFESCGAQYRIVGDPLEETDVDSVVLALVNLAKEGKVEDYQSSKRKDFNNFKVSVAYFWDNLVAECHNGPLFDGILLEKCTDYVIAISCTPPRVFRLVASLIGLQLVSSFITIATMLGSQRETTQRQLDAEKKKRAEGPRAESLKKRVETTHDKITSIEQLMDKIFKGLFMHRYRDIDANIRVSCIQSLGNWILSYPSLFLQDKYLKYLGWTLNDKSAGVRKASITALQSLYEADDNVPSLDLFTQRFHKRMIELADDIDVSVAVCAIGLVKQLLRHQLLADDNLGPFYDLLVVEPPEIRRAIGELVYDHLIAQKFNSSQPRSKGDTESSLLILSRMLQILREFSTAPILITYVIDDVWEYMIAMKDWKCIISMLLDENPSIELTETDATNLIRLLCASVKRAVGERIVPATDNRKHTYTKAQKEAFESSKRDLTVAMMKNYPQLLRKYVADKAKAPPLIEIVLHMKLELYSLKRQEQNFKTALQLMREAFFKHGDKDSLRSCVKAINFCSAESKGELQEFATTKLKELEDELIVKLKTAIKDVTDGDDDYPLLVNLKRLYELQLSRPVPIESLYEEFASMLEIFRDLNKEMNSFLLLNMLLHLKWCLCNIVNAETVSETSLSSLCSKRDTLFKLLESFLPTSEVEEMTLVEHQLACRVCTILVELWCLFRKSKYSSTALEVLGCCPEQSILEMFWKLCEQQLDISFETEDEDVNREYVEETTRDTVIIAASQLVATDTVQTDYLASEIISHFMMHGTNIAEVIKQLITVLRKKDENVFGIYLKALQKAYNRHLVKRTNSDGRSSVTKSFLDCKELASQLSATFVGFARSKHRLDILKIAEEGIEYAFTDAPQRLSFLECAVLPFAEKLPSIDVVDLLKNVERRTEHINTDEDPSGWRPYHKFVESLLEKCAKTEAFAGGDEKEGTTVRRRGRATKQSKLQGKKLFEEHTSSEDEDEDMISTSDQEAPDDEDKEDEVEEDTALIHVIRSSKLKSRTASKTSGGST